MSLSKRDFFDQPIRNVGSETIPAFAVVEVKSPGLVKFAGREWFTVGKPSSQGKVYFVNGPFDVPANGTSGAAMPYRAPGVHALFKPDLDPATNDELGPIDGQWYLGEGNGFFVVGDIQGSPASLPGFPSSASTLRVRVMTTAVANEVDRIQGTVASTVSPTTPQFLINKIFVLSGVDPRPEPHSPIQTVVVENNLEKAYVNGVDRVTATRNKTDGKWYVETVPAEAEPVIYCEAIENKGYQNPKCLAKPVAISGAIDNELDPFYLVDDQNQFYLRATYTDASPSTVHVGYRGFAVRFSEDYSEGIPGYRIITMEGPAQLLLVELIGDVASASASCNILPDPGVFGKAFRGRRPRIESAGFDFTAHDPHALATEAKSGEQWIVTWDETNERYIFIRPLQIFIRVKGTVSSTVSASTTSFSAGSIELIQGDMPELSGGNITVFNVAKVALPNTTVAEFRWNREEQQWETEPLVCHEVLGLATAAVTGGTFTIDNIEIVCGSDPRTDPSSAAETLSVANPFAWDIDDNGQVLAVKKASGTWIAVQAACPA